MRLQCNTIAENNADISQAAQTQPSRPSTAVFHMSSYRALGERQTSSITAPEPIRSVAALSHGRLPVSTLMQYISIRVCYLTS